MKLPVIDFSSFDLKKPESLVNIDHALPTTGFMAVSSLDVSATLFAEIFQHSKSFFCNRLKNKRDMPIVQRLKKFVTRAGTSLKQRVARIPCQP